MLPGVVVAGVTTSVLMLVVNSSWQTLAAFRQAIYVAMEVVPGVMVPHKAKLAVVVTSACTT
jgi:hypothetical protein